MAQLKPLKIFHKCLLPTSSSHLIVPTRNLWYKPDGKGRTKKRFRANIPLNWREVNFNPSNIPAAWIPKDYELKNTIDYEHEKELAKYIPGYKAKVPPHEEANFHGEAICKLDNSNLACYGLKQMANLTKSCVIHNLPSDVECLVDELWTEKQDKQVIDLMQRAHLFDIDPDKVHKNRNSKYHLANRRCLQKNPHRICKTMASEMIRFSNIRGFQLDLNDVLQRMTSEDTPITASYQLANNFSTNMSLVGLPDSWKIQFQSKPPIQALSKKAVKLYANAEEIQASMNAPAEDIYPALPISGIPTTNHYDFINKTGFSSNTPFSHIHTIVEYNTESRTKDEFHGQMLKSLFISLFSRVNIQADDQGEELTNDLKQPLSANCIGLDGQKFHFICLQLNTVSFDSIGGIKNMIWVSDEMNLFDECSNFTWKSADYYTHYNPQVFKTFQALWLNGVV